MPSIAPLGTGLLCIVAGGYGFAYPQRQYEIRQRRQTNDDPQLSEAGKLKWRVLDLVLVLLGVAVVFRHHEVSNRRRREPEGGKADRSPAFGDHGPAGF